MNMATVHGALAWAVVAAIVLQVFLAGSSVPQLGGSGSFLIHVEVGRIVGVAFLALVIAAVAARSGRRRIGQAAGLLGLYIVQSILPYMDPGLPFAAALHPVNALAMFALAVLYARQVWRERGAPAGAAAA
jgi:Family of unknown function (DUF6220)